MDIWIRCDILQYIILNDCVWPIKISQNIKVKINNELAEKILRGEVHSVVSHKSVWLFPLWQGHQKPVNDTRDMSGIPHSCLGCVSHVYSLWAVQLMLSKAKFWLKKVNSLLERLQDLIFGNQETRQLELWNLAQWEILLIVPGKVFWRKCIGGLGANINRALMWNHCRSPSPSALIFQKLTLFERIK